MWRKWVLGQHLIRRKFIHPSRTHPQRSKPVLKWWNFTCFTQNRPWRNTVPPKRRRTYTQLVQPSIQGTTHAEVWCAFFVFDNLFFFYFGFLFCSSTPLFHNLAGSSRTSFRVSQLTTILVYSLRSSLLIQVLRLWDALALELGRNKRWFWSFPFSPLSHLGSIL